MYARDQGLIATPIGSILVQGDELVIQSIQILEEARDEVAPQGRAVTQALEQLRTWFAGELTRFDLPLAPAATPRGQELRAALIALPYGNTLSYGSFARLHGSAPRAVGQLCARNPFPIVVPCHRITASGGALGHYSAGRGPATKAWLLDHERQHSHQESLL